MQWLKTNTAVVVTVGPFLDVTDGVTPEIALTVTNCLLTLVAETDAGSAPTLVLDVAPTASAGSNDMVHITSDSAGYYSLELTAANLNRLGRIRLNIIDTDVHLPVFHDYMIVPANVYDALVLGTDTLQADVTQWLGTAAATPTTAGVPEVDVTHVSGTAQTARDIGASVLLSSGTGTGQLDFTSGVVKANLIQILGTALTETAGQIAAAFKQFFDVGTPTGTMKAITAVGTVTGNVDGNVGGNVTGSVGSVTGAVGSVTGAVGSVTGAVGSVTGNVGGNVTGSVGSVSGHTAQTGDTFALANGATGFVAIDTVVDAVKVKTDQLTFTKTNEVDSNVQSINGATIVGDGNATPWDGA